MYIDTGLSIIVRQTKRYSNIAILAAITLTRVLEGVSYVKIPSYHCKNSHYNDKTVSRPSHIYDVNPYNYSWKDIFFILKRGPGMGI